MKTGNTCRAAVEMTHGGAASMEPGHEDREYVLRDDPEHSRTKRASMEPGHEDREYPAGLAPGAQEDLVPQWSPVMKTGNTRSAHHPSVRSEGLNGARS